MNKRVTTAILTLLLVIASFGSGYLIAQSPFAPVQIMPSSRVPNNLPEDFDIFWESWNLVHQRYFDRDLDDVVLIEGAIDGMMNVLDRYSYYLPPEQEAASRDRLEGEFEGIGAYIEQIEDAIVIVSPIAGSPAEAAGLQPEDIIREADGVDLTSMSASDAAALIRGPAGTTVDLLIERDGELLEVSITRDSVEIVSVTGEMLEDGIAYVRITQFTFRTTGELEAVLNDLAQQAPHSMILDLRRNPGGSLTAVVDVADQFLAEGIVLVEQFGDEREQLYRSDDDDTLAEEIPLVVLIDEGSASASEVLAGAIKDRQRGILIGETSFGKGTVQSLHTLSNGGGLRLSVTRWLTPDSVWINETGLEPDHLIPFEGQPGVLLEEDVQLRAALDYLQGRPLTASEESDAVNE
jgi:carboxyl-terminal processing protease